MGNRARGILPRALFVCKGPALSNDEGPALSNDEAVCIPPVSTTCEFLERSSTRVDDIISVNFLTNLPREARLYG